MAKPSVVKLKRMMKATRLGVTMSFLCPSNRYDLSLTETEN